MKKCRKCQLDKGLSEFYRDKKAKDGLYSYCKPCHQSINNKKRYPYIHKHFRTNPTPNTVAVRYVNNISWRAGKMPLYKKVKNFLTVESLEKWLDEHWTEFMELYKEWERNNFKRAFIPVLDRIDPKGHYEIPNIRLLTLAENSRVANLGRKQSAEHLTKRVSGIKVNKKQINEIRKRHKNGEKQRDLAEEYGISQTLVSFIVVNKVSQYGR